MLKGLFISAIPFLSALVFSPFIPSYKLLFILHFLSYHFTSNIVSSSALLVIQIMISLFLVLLRVTCTELAWFMFAFSYSIRQVHQCTCHRHGSCLTFVFLVIYHVTKICVHVILELQPAIPCWWEFQASHIPFQNILFSALCNYIKTFHCFLIIVVIKFALKFEY